MTIRLLFAFCALAGPAAGQAAALRGSEPAAPTPSSVPTRTSVDTRSLLLPKVGDCTLLILTPSVLELTLISAGEPDSVRRSAATFSIAVNGRPIQAAAFGWKRRVAYAPLARRDLRVATEYYLLLAEPLSPAAGSPIVEVRVPAGALRQSPIEAAAAFDPLRLSPVIHVNQEGYVPELPKKAMVGYFLGDRGELEIPPSAGFFLVDAHSGTTVYHGSLEPRPDVGYKTTPLPYQKVLQADFSAFRTPGEYRLEVPGLGASFPFLIDDGIAMGFARTYALGLYEQRCGTSEGVPFTRFGHGACHVEKAQIPSPQSDPQFAFTWATIARYAGEPSPDNPAQTAPLLTSEAAQLYPFVNRGAIDVSGGHHDAGDYSKYTANSAELIHYLVFAVDSIPGVAALDNLGIPESGDGIPDVLQEAKWEADYLAKLQDADGGFYFLVYPKTREYESDVLPDRGDRQVVWPKNTSATAAAVAALAQCSSSPAFRKYYPVAAAGYLRKARLGWDFLTKAIAKYGKDGAYQKITFYSDHYTHDDELAWAACELYLATGESQYRQKLSSWFPNPADSATFRWGWWRLSECWGNAIRSYAFAARSGRLPASALDARYLRICEGEILAAADDALAWSRKNAYATPFPLPTKAVLSAGWYFSLDQASDMAVAYQIEPKPAYLDALVGAMNYVGGTNPVNVTYLTGLGIKRQREIVDQYAQNDRRVLPPSGIPIGNIQTAFQYLPHYGAELRSLTYPADDAATGSYPFYDRWSDAYNVTTEFIAVNQARGLLAAAFLASRTSAASQPWTPVRAEIILPPGKVELRMPVTVAVKVSGRDLANARVVWEARDQDPAFGPTCTLSPRNAGEQWVEAEVEWPDGLRAFAANHFAADSSTVSWLDGALPADAVPASSGGDGWSWTDGAPPPPCGALVHRSNLANGLHEHWFTGASAPLAIGAGDSLFAWVNLDPAHPPTEIMLTWNDGSSWEHRAYWGADTITYGRNGSPGRIRAGPLPLAGRWVRLSVPARAVGLENSTVNGMGFSLVDGRAAWACAGRSAAP